MLASEACLGERGGPFIHGEEADGHIAETRQDDPLHHRQFEAARRRLLRVRENSFTKGLQVRVSPLDGGKSWSLRYRIGRRQRRLTLGRDRVLTLGEARKAATHALKLVSKGVNPATVKRETRESDTVADFATTYIAKYAQKMKKSWKTNPRYLTHEILPLWKHRPMKEITRRDVRALLEGVATRPAPVVANRVRSLLSKLFNVAIQRDVVELNPVSATEKPTQEQARNSVLTRDEIRGFWSATERLSMEMRAAWRLRLLTAQRGGEVFGMRWQDVDLAAGLWTIPASGSKNKMAHRVPLSPQALTILTAVREHVDERLKQQKEPKPSLYVFALARGKRQQAEAAATFRSTIFTDMIFAARARHSWRRAACRDWSSRRSSTTPNATTLHTFMIAMDTTMKNASRSMPGPAR